MTEIFLIDNARTCGLGMDVVSQEGVCNWCGQLGGRRIGKGLLSSRPLIGSPEKNQFLYRHREVGLRSGAILSCRPYIRSVF